MISAKLAATIVTVMVIVVIAVSVVLYMQSLQNATPSASPSPSDTDSAGASVSNGAALYAINCASCHGPLESSNRRGRTASQILAAISSVNAMKSLSTLTNAQVRDIASALTSPAATGATPPAPSPSGSAASSASPSSGAALYTQYCAECHGQLAASSKIGRTAAQIQNAISSVGAMSSLSTLEPIQIQAIASALASPASSSPFPSATLTPQLGTSSPTVSTSPGSGAALYIQYCAGCHGPLATSAKLGRTATQIQNAINSVGAMGSLSTLTTPQVQAIATALVNPTGSKIPSPSTSPAPTEPPPVGTSFGSNGQYEILVWNDLGMHCYNPSFSALSVLPPYNNLWAQVILRGGEHPTPVTSGIRVTYQILGNTYSVGKTDFWSYAQELFNVTLQPNVGLTGKGLSGTMDAVGTHFEASGIPLTEYLDSDVTSAPKETWTRHPYQMALIIAYNSATGAELCRTTAVAPVSTEMDCQTCHSDGGLAMTRYPTANKTGNVYTNILSLHDYLHPQMPTLTSSQPVLCQQCHSDNALGISGKAGVPNLSNAMHSNHNSPAIPIANNTDGCYACHPGPVTRCYRDAMQTMQGFTCQTCHGDLGKVGQNSNPWLNEPRCDSPECHGAAFALNSASGLYRLSTSRGVYCEGCHDSQHAIAPSSVNYDGLKFVVMQGDNWYLKNCTVCHTRGVGSLFHGVENTVLIPATPSADALWSYAIPMASMAIIAVGALVARNKTRRKLNNS